MAQIDDSWINIYKEFGEKLVLFKDENRKASLRGIKEEFNLNSNVPYGFDALPTLMPLNAIFYYFEDKRGKDDIQNIWDLFIAAHNLVNEETEENKKRFCELFDKTKVQIGVSWRITTGLFWIFPYRFFSMDSHKRRLVKLYTIYHKL